MLEKRSPVDQYKPMRNPTMPIRKLPKYQTTQKVVAILDPSKLPNPVLHIVIVQMLYYSDIIWYHMPGKGLQ